MKRLSAHKYVRLTTFTRDGRPKHTSMWIAGLSADVVVTTTNGNSWKIKRLRNTPNVELAPSDGRGNIRTGIEPVPGLAKIIDRTHTGFAELEAALRIKYGIPYKFLRFFGKLLGKNTCGIVITLGDNGSTFEID